MLIVMQIRLGDTKVNKFYLVIIYDRVNTASWVCKDSDTNVLWLDVIVYIPDAMKSLDQRHHLYANLQNGLSTEPFSRLLLYQSL